MQAVYSKEKKQVSGDEKLRRLQTLFVCKHTPQCYSVLSGAKVFPNVLSKKMCHFSGVSLWPLYLRVVLASVVYSRLTSELVSFVD